MLGSISQVLIMRTWPSLERGIFIPTTVFSILRMRHDVWEWTGLPQHNKHEGKTIFKCKYYLATRSLFSSVAQSCPTLCDPHGWQHARLPCPSPIPRVYSNSCPSSQWRHPTFSFSVIPFFSHLQSFPASGSFLVESVLHIRWPMCFGVSASISVLPKNIQDWFLLGWTGWISLKSKRLSRVFSNTFKSINSSALSFVYCPTHIHTQLLGKP